MTINIFTLRALAAREGTTYSNLRTIIFKLLKAGEALEWRTYRFERGPGAWLALPKDADVKIIDEEKEGGEAL